MFVSNKNPNSQAVQNGAAYDNTAHMKLAYMYLITQKPWKAAAISLARSLSI